jgi:hypothetical protein
MRTERHCESRQEKDNRKVSFPNPLGKRLSPFFSAHKINARDGLCHLSFQITDWVQSKKIGYYVAPEKLEYMGWESFMALGRYVDSGHSLLSLFAKLLYREEGWSFTLLNPDTPVQEQGEFDLILCKCNRYVSDI